MRPACLNYGNTYLKSRRLLLNQIKYNLAKIENLYKNYFTSVLLTGVEHILNIHLPEQIRV
jgi:hypothetical protein